MKKIFFALFVSMTMVSWCQDFMITKNSVGPITLGMHISEIPKSVPGLYDYVKPNEYNSELLEFYKNGEEIMNGWFFEQDQMNFSGDLRLGSIDIVGPCAAKVDVGGKMYGMKDNVKSLIDNKTLKRNNPKIITYYVYNGIFFCTDPSNDPSAKPNNTNVIHRIRIEDKKFVIEFEP